MRVFLPLIRRSCVCVCGISIMGKRSSVQLLVNHSAARKGMKKKAVEREGPQNPARRRLILDYYIYDTCSIRTIMYKKYFNVINFI